MTYDLELMKTFEGDLLTYLQLNPNAVQKFKRIKP